MYRRAGRALNVFFAEWTAPFCSRCLELMRSHHRGDPRADVDLVDGVFPGCCHAGVAESLSVPRGGENGQFTPDLRQAFGSARRSVPLAQEPQTYAVLERQTGRRAQGVACIHLGPAGCRLGDLKAPLCLTFLCDPVRAALANSAGWGLVGSDSDDFCGARAALLSVVSGTVESARRAVDQLEDRLARLGDRLREASAMGRASLFSTGGLAHTSPAKGSSPSASTR